MSCLPGGLGCVSERVGVHRHAVAACIVGLVVLLTGCFHEPEVVQVECRVIEPQVVESLGNKLQKSLLYYYWSDGTSTFRFAEVVCPTSLVP